MTTKQLEGLLVGWGKLISKNPPIVANSKDSLDTKALNQLPATLVLIETLKANGINSRDDLRKKGFLAASMILKF